MVKCVLFDMDGTLVDSYPGIALSYRRTFAGLGLPFPGEDFVRRVIGLPLLRVFQRECGMDDALAARAAALYREHYREAGIRGAEACPGMEDALWGLKELGLSLGVATLKQEGFAREILIRTGLAPCFSTVQGMDEKDRRAKAEMILRAGEKLGAAPQELVLVGDSFLDGESARQAGAGFLAVSYGFGVWEQEDLRPLGALGLASSPGEVLAYFQTALRSRG